MRLPGIRLGASQSTEGWTFPLFSLPLFSSVRQRPGSFVSTSGFLCIKLNPLNGTGIMKMNIRYGQNLLSCEIGWIEDWQTQTHSLTIRGEQQNSAEELSFTREIINRKRNLDKLTNV